MNYLSNKLSEALKDQTLPVHRRSNSLNPSAASIQFTDVSGNIKTIGGCHRQSFYKMTGERPDDGIVVNVDWTFSALTGEKMHELLVNMISNFGFAMGIQLLAEEHTIYDEVSRLSGRTDMIAWDYNKDEPIGIEMKSIGEYKCKSAVEQPIEEHVLQSVVYLDFYNKNIPPGQKRITKWYLWYISRTENWTIKAKPHNSQFTMLWDYCIELDGDVPIVTLSNGTKQRWTQFSVSEIYKRYGKLKKEVDSKSLPARDYEQTYSEEKILALHKAGQISRKTDRDSIDRWVKKGAPPGKLKVTLGDGECMFCEYSKRCWEGTVPKNTKVFSNFPLEATPQKKEPAKKDDYYL